MFLYPIRGPPVNTGGDGVRVVGHDRQQGPGAGLLNGAPGSIHDYFLIWRIASRASLVSISPSQYFRRTSWFSSIHFFNTAKSLASILPSTTWTFGRIATDTISEGMALGPGETFTRTSC